MKHIFNLLCLFLVYACTTNAQQSIVVTINNAAKGTYELKQLKANEQITIATAKVKNKKIAFYKNLEPGLYAIFNANKGFSFIVNEPNIILKTNWQLPYSNVNVIQSEENKAWINYKNKRDIVFNKLKLLQPITIGYDKTTDFYQAAKKEFYQIQNSLKQFSKSIDTSLLANLYIQADIRPKLLHNKPYNAQKEVLKKQWLHTINWKDDRLLNTDILPVKIDDYMRLYFDKSFTVTQQEEAFEKGIDQLLIKASKNTNIKDFVMSYLVQKLQQFNMENVILHIAENHANTEDSCEKTSTNSEIIARLKQFENMRVGKIAPEISALNLKDEKVNPFTNATHKNLLIFWSSQCSHCRNLMPKVNKWYKTVKQQGWNLITISLDTKKESLKNFINEFKLNFPVYTDYKGWESKIALDYNVSATPAMFTLNKDRKILAKPNFLHHVK